MTAHLSDLASFVSVVDHGSISAAARANGVPKSTISRRISRLEAELGVALVTRASQRIGITAEGRQLHARSVGALAELREAQQQLRQGQQAPHGVLVITAPHDVARSAMFVDLLQAYQRRCPAVRIDARLESRYVDLVREGVDVAIRAHVAGVPGDPELRSRLISTMPVAFFASAAYLRAHGTPTTPEDLATHALLVHGAAQRAPIPISSGGRVVHFAPEAPTITSNDFGLIQALLARDSGIALLPLPLATGEGAPPLIRVLPGWTAQHGRLSVVWPQRRYSPAKVRTFIDLAVERLGAAP